MDGMDGATAPTPSTIESFRQSLSAGHSAMLADGPSVGSPLAVRRLVPTGGDVEQPGDYDTPSAGPGLNRLDSQETSVRIDFDKWMAEKGSREDFFREPGLDTKSLCSCFRHSGWQPIRRRVYESLKRCKCSASRIASFGTCGSYSFVERSAVHPEKFRIRHNHCNDRLCTPCANTRSFRLRESIFNLIADKPVSFITFTLCGKGESLATLLDRLYRHFRAMRLHPVWSERVRGGVAFLEIKYSDKARRWHPHLHILADASFIPKSELVDAWRSITKDSYVVDISRVVNQAVTGSYVTKYASKPLNTSFSNSAELLDEAVRALKGRRLCFAFGSWYGKALVDTDLDGDDALDMIQMQWEIFVDLEELLLRATNGNPESIGILKSMNAEAQWRSTLSHSPP